MKGVAKATTPARKGHSPIDHKAMSLGSRAVAPGALRGRRDARRVRIGYGPVRAVASPRDGARARGVRGRSAPRSPARSVAARAVVNSAVMNLPGMGADGHTASIFPGPDYDEALNGPKERRALGLMPDPLPPEAPVARVTLSRAGIVSARSIMFAISGPAKKKVLEDAIKEGASSPYPVGRVLAEVELPIDIHWSEQ